MSAGDNIDLIGTSLKVSWCTDEVTLPTPGGDSHVTSDRSRSL